MRDALPFLGGRSPRNQGAPPISRQRFGLSFSPENTLIAPDISLMKNLDLAVQFFLQLAVILVFCRIVGAVAARFGQPQVVAEMIAGVMLGPSLFGLLWPAAQQWLFPWDATQETRDTQGYLFPASQLGLALYMFVVGMEFRMDIVQRRLKSSIAVSLAGMVTPFVLGAGLAWIFFHSTELFPKRTSLTEAMLFLGASMCITSLKRSANSVRNISSI